mmetsp:Transcript_15285/g.27704  ORF Transcript_15285/g.27704 Transcript_15285/m.27704 type:complete len:237 (+) Transcript_15285:1078-1788(+)
MFELVVGFRVVGFLVGRGVGFLVGRGVGLFVGLAVLILGAGVVSPVDSGLSLFTCSWLFVVGLKVGLDEAGTSVGELDASTPPTSASENTLLWPRVPPPPSPPLSSASKFNATTTSTTLAKSRSALKIIVFLIQGLESATHAGKHFFFEGGSPLSPDTDVAPETACFGFSTPVFDLRRPPTPRGMASADSGGAPARALEFMLETSSPLNVLKLNDWPSRETRLPPVSDCVPKCSYG